MTREEANKLLAVMQANYHYAFKTMKTEDKYLLLDSWTAVLSDISGEIVMLAAMKLIAKSKWMPTAAEVRKACQNLYYEALAARMEGAGERDGIYRQIMAKTQHLRGEENGIRLKAMLGGEGMPALMGLSEETRELPGGDEWEAEM